MKCWHLILQVTVLGLASADYTELEGAKFLKTTGKKSQTLSSKVSFAAWDNEVSFTNETDAALVCSLLFIRYTYNIQIN